MSMELKYYINQKGEIPDTALSPDRRRSAGAGQPLS